MLGKLILSLLDWWVVMGLATGAPCISHAPKGNSPLLKAARGSIGLPGLPSPLFTGLHHHVDGVPAHPASLALRGRQQLRLQRVVHPPRGTEVGDPRAGGDPGAREKPRIATGANREANKQTNMCLRYMIYIYIYVYIYANKFGNATTNTHFTSFTLLRPD